MTKYQKQRIEARYTDLEWLIERPTDELSIARYCGELAGIRYAVESSGYHFYNGKIITDSEWHKLTHT